MGKAEWNVRLYLAAGEKQEEQDETVDNCHDTAESLQHPSVQCDSLG